MRFSEVAAGRPDALEKAAAHLAAGGLLVHPTSGVYGLGGVLSEAAAAEVTRLKGRGDRAGFVYLGADEESLRESFPTAQWPPLARRLADAFWPGPLTLVLADGSERGIAVRVEPHETTRAILATSGGVLGSTSLNRSGEAPAWSAPGARQVLEGFPPSEFEVLFVEAGELAGPPPSTLVRVPGAAGGTYDVLREGAIATARIAMEAEG